MLTAEQIELRQHGIGGSEQPILAGISPRMMAAELYWRKRGEWPADAPVDDDLAFLGEMGHAAEAPLAGWLERELGVEFFVQHQTKFHPDPLIPLLGHCDRRQRRSRSGAEFKMRARRDGWGRTLGDEYPLDVNLQCQQYMMLWKADYWHLAVLIAGVDRRRYVVGADRGMQDAIIEQSLDFWSCVQLGTPPPIDFEHKTAARYHQVIHPFPTGDQIVLPEDADDWIRSMDLADARKKELDGMRSAARARLEDYIGDASVAYTHDRSRMVVRKRTNHEPPRIQLSIRNTPK